MSTATAIAVSEPKQVRLISKDQFLLKYKDREDGFKYEWNNGIVEKSKHKNQQQSKFFYLILALFLKTEAAKNGGMLITETDMETTPFQTRRPDIAFYTGVQLPLMWKGKNQIAPWVIEVISPSDNADKIFEKLNEYFSSGVKVVWHIFPTSQQIYVYTSPEDVTICRGKTVCSGMPAIPDFSIKAEEFFI
jgi:Uma2 family endonuclease